MIFRLIVVHLFYRKTDSSSLHVYVDHANINNLSDLHNFRRFLNEFIRKFTEMHKSVLMDPNVNKSAEISDVADGSFQDLTNL